MRGAGERMGGGGACEGRPRELPRTSISDIEPNMFQKAPPFILSVCSAEIVSATTPEEARARSVRRVGGGGGMQWAGGRWSVQVGEGA